MKTSAAWLTIGCMATVAVLTGCEDPAESAAQQFASARMAGGLKSLWRKNEVPSSPTQAWMYEERACMSRLYARLRSASDLADTTEAFDSYLQSLRRVDRSSLSPELDGAIVTYIQEVHLLRDQLRDAPAWMDTVAGRLVLTGEAILSWFVLWVDVGGARVGVQLDQSPGLQLRDEFKTRLDQVRRSWAAVEIVAATSD